MNQLSRFLVKTYSAATVEAAKKLTAKLRRDAYTSGWPTPASRFLVVEYGNGQYTVKYPKAMSSRILDLEYGTQSNPPTPVIRPFIRSIRDTGMKKEIEKSLKKARLY